MSVVAADPGSSAPALEERPPGRLPRAWSAPVWAHLVALGVILLALAPLVGTNVSFSADEGAAAIQAQSLARGDGWIVEHPLPEVDPDGEYYPLENSERGPRGLAPFAKHPLYAVGLAAADRMAGFPGMVGLSILGTIAAAGLAAALARRLDHGLVRPTVWVVGLASPLLFDGFVVIAHTVGAAAAVAAVLLAVIAIERRSVLLALPVAPAVVLAVLMRNEALFLGAGLGVAAAFVALRRRSLPAASVAGVAMVAAAAAHLGERVWLRHIVGGNVGVGGSISNGGGSVLAGRIRGLVQTWLTPSYGGHRQVGFLLLVMLLALVLGTVAVRRHPSDRGRILFLSGLAATAALAALVVRPTNLVPGLLLAFPLMAPGILLLRRSQLGTTTAQLAVGTCALFAAGVIATQYSRGGTAEWGGRYFALGLPIIVPVLLRAIRAGGRRLDPTARRGALAAVVVCSVALAAMGVGSMRYHHRFTAELTASIDRAGEETGVQRPVFVTTSGFVPRTMWRGFEDQRWLLARSTGLGELVDRLRARGVSSFVLVTRRLEDDRRELAATVETSSPFGRPDGSGWQVRVLRTS